MNTLHQGTAGASDRSTFRFQRVRSRVLVNVAQFEEPDIAYSAIQIVSQHLEHAGKRGRAHD